MPRSRYDDGASGMRTIELGYVAPLERELIEPIPQHVPCLSFRTGAPPQLLHVDRLVVGHPVTPWVKDSGILDRLREPSVSPSRQPPKS